MKITFFLASLLFTANTFAQVSAFPSYQDLGRVHSPGQRSTSVSFMNSSAVAISNFSTFCSGDMNVFSCSSSCFSLSAYGSCTVWITFSPLANDGAHKNLILQAFGGTVFTQAQISASDDLSSPQF